MLFLSVDGRPKASDYSLQAAIAGLPECRLTTGCSGRRHAPPLNRSVDTYANEHVRLKRFKSLTNLGNERLERFHTVAVGHEHDNGHRQRLQVLLELDVLVGSQQRVERSRRLAKQRTVAQTGPTHLRNGASVMARQQVRERPGQRFIEQESHERSAGP